eukprot:CAMPEP_0203807740 /NCGR_PEP_ID=MMETSP0115-20131106/1230_1 /ASSEMBLY_ACC=CAM_ASM_000227 /TAXON_ID=33651 /ORGANISM="Bicosoecid sp, Strain ms1" /LENGTH=440 /DNA_ID=CAMNT_0050716425 /DNA_START=137 /DNA_END=1456 /DNA_ORIENTATION=+
MALLAVVAALSLLSGVAAEVVEVCVVGDVMDVYCINRGTLLDASSYRTLEHPGQHSIHCLVDVSFCYGSGFEILVPPTSGSDYCRAVRLDTAGRDAAMAMARQSTSACSTCTGPSSGPSKGFRATVRGTIDTASTASPPVLTTTSVEAANVGCGGEPLHPLTCGEAVDNGDNEDGDGGSSSSSTGSTDASSGGDGGSDGSDADRDDEEARALLAGVGLPRAAVLHRPSEGDAPDVAVAWSLTGSMVEVAIAARSAGWVAVGFAPAGAEATSAMVGSDVVMGAVIGDGEGGGGGEADGEAAAAAVAAFKLTQQVESAYAWPVGSATHAKAEGWVTAASVARDGGVLTLRFTRDLADVGEGDNDASAGAAPGVDTALVWSFSNDAPTPSGIPVHAERGLVRLKLAGGDGTIGSQSSASSPALVFLLSVLAPLLTAVCVTLTT